MSNWWVVGPFDLGEKDKGWETRHIGEPDVSTVARYMSGKTRVQWKPVRSEDPQGKIDLRASLANRDHCVGYAYAEILLERPVEAVLLLGVDDSEKVWVNGDKVFELFTSRGLRHDQDRVPVKLKAGTNTILLKLYQDTLGWEFCAGSSLPTAGPSRSPRSRSDRRDCEAPDDRPCPLPIAPGCGTRSQSVGAGLLRLPTPAPAITLEFGRPPDRGLAVGHRRPQSDPCIPGER